MWLLARKGWFMASHCRAFVLVACPRWLLPPQFGPWSYCLRAALLWRAGRLIGVRCPTIGCPVPTGLSRHSATIHSCASAHLCWPGTEHSVGTISTCSVTSAATVGRHQLRRRCAGTWSKALMRMVCACYSIFAGSPEVWPHLLIDLRLSTGFKGSQCGPPTHLLLTRDLGRH